MLEKKTDKCAHPGCECSVPTGGKYCSDYCESVANRQSIACECGHGECAAAKWLGTAG